MPPLKTHQEFQRSTSPVTVGVQQNIKSSLRETYAQKVLLNLNSLREDGRFCDVEIVANGIRFNVHRAVLSSSSTYFEAMFRPALGIEIIPHFCSYTFTPIFKLGLCEGKQKSVILHSIDPNILKLLIDFVYTGFVHIEQHNVQELLAAADMLQIPEVVSECCDFLCRELHPSNALGILRFAEAHHCEELAQSAQNYVFTNFPQVQHSVFNHFPYSN